MFPVVPASYTQTIQQFINLAQGKDIKSSANSLTSVVSSSNSLSFKTAKMKAMLFTTSQLEKLHGLEQHVLEFKCNYKTLENVNKFKLLGKTMGKNLN